MISSQRAGEILADAFLHYPLMCYAFDGHTVEERSKLVLQLYTRCAAAASMYGGIVATDDLTAALIWLPSSNFPLSLWQEVRSGMGLIPVKLGPKATLRLIRHDAEPEGWIRQQEDEKMGYIWCLGVAADQRGKGYSRILIDKTIAEMKAQGLTSFWLKTEDPKNVAIYLKLGFEMIYETVVKSSGINSWVFKRTY